MTPQTEAPRPKKQWHTLIGADGAERRDPYYWLRERESDQVQAHLNAENEWTKSQLLDTEDLQEQLFQEIKGRIKQDDNTVPAKKGNWYYYARCEDGKQYAIHCRRAAGVSGPEGPEQILLDVNSLADGHEFFSIAGATVSPDGNLLAYCQDDCGRRIYTLYIKDLRTGELLEDCIPEMSGDVVWANDNQTIFYVKQDLETLRDHLVLRHKLGADVAKDCLVFDEVDDTFHAGLYRSRSGEFIFIYSSQTITDEIRYIDANLPESEVKLFHPRQRGLEYGVDHGNGKFWIRTNLDAQNFRLMSADAGATSAGQWQEFIAHDEEVFLEDFTLFENFLVLEERCEALPRLRVMRWNGEENHCIALDEPAYLISVGDNREFKSSTLRYEYESMTTPDSVFDYDMETRTSTLMKQVEVLGGFSSADYQTERLWAPAEDGSKIPISLVFRKDQNSDQPAPLLLYAYGAYGISMDPYFSSIRMSLLDRGFVFAIAHVRGGQELGRKWYEDGKLFKKTNTFTDFIDCAKCLINQGYTEPRQLYAQGGSAGGLVMGVVLNEAPELWNGMIAQVPFVDVMTTMEDDSIPLTTFEYDEWGNPADLDAYQCMINYSPYDNVKERQVPNLLVTTGLHDSQVQYWEPAKWVAKLRDHQTSNNLLLLKTEMNAGHGGVSGRFRQYREVALDYAFLLKLAGRMQTL